MSDSKTKPTIEAVPLAENIPDKPSQRLEHSMLVGGFLVGRYSGTGDMALCQLADKPKVTIMSNPSPITCFTSWGSEVVSLHANETLQVLNVNKMRSDKYPQEKGTTEGVRRIVANSKYVVAIGAKRLLVWARDSLAKPPRVVDLTGAPTPITTISERTTMGAPDRVVIVNNSPGGHIFQVWDVVAGQLCCYAENSSATETFMVDANEDGVVVATNRDCLTVWLTAEHAAGAAVAVEPYQTKRYLNTMLSTLYIDRDIIITGDNFGCMNVHTSTGCFLFHLNYIRTAGDESADLKTTNRTELASLFRTKVNKILRVGRWIIASFENSRVRVYDIFSPRAAEPCDIFTHPVADTVIRDISVYGRTVYALALQPADSKESKASKTGRARADLVSWVPRLEIDSMAFFYGDANLWHGSPLLLLLRATTRSTVVLKKVESVFTPDVYAVHETSLKNAVSYLESIMELQRLRGVTVPFMVIQNAQAMLDELDICLHKILKGQKISKHRDKTELHRVNFMHAIDLCLQAADFLVQVKNTTGSLVPYSEKMDQIPRFDDGIACVSADDRSSLSLSVAARGSVRAGPRTPALSATGGRTATVSYGGGGSESFMGEEMGIDGMLITLLQELGSMQESALETVEHFDNVCNEYLKDQDKINSLLSIFTKLRQLNEDMKQAGKEIGELCGEDPSGEWWQYGGEYDDGAGN